MVPFERLIQGVVKSYFGNDLNTVLHPLAVRIIFLKPLHHLPLCFEPHTETIGWLVRVKTIRFVDERTGLVLCRRPSDKSVASQREWRNRRWTGIEHKGVLGTKQTEKAVQQKEGKTDVLINASLIHAREWARLRKWTQFFVGTPRTELI